MKKRSRSQRVKGALASVAVLAVTGVGWTAWAGEEDVSGTYRWASVTTGSVTTTTSLTGTVQPAGRKDLQFATSGTVEKVSVKNGDTVKKGQTLVTLNRTALQRKVRAAESELAIAKATLAAHEAGQQALVSSAASSGSGGGAAGGVAPSSVTTDSAGSSSSISQATTAQAAGSGGTGGTVNAVAAVYRTSSSGSVAAATSSSVAAATSSSVAAATSSSVATVAPSADVTAALADVKTQQEAVKAAQSTVSAAKQAAQDALAAQQAACGVAYSHNTADDASLNEACDSALTAVQAAQAELASAQETLGTALDTLAATLGAAASTMTGVASDLAAQESDLAAREKALAQQQASGSPSSTPSEQASGSEKPSSGATQPDASGGGSGPEGPTSQPQAQQQGQSPSSGGQTGQSPTPGTAGTAGAATGASQGTTITAAQLASDQADVDQAQADLVAARTALRGAVIKAPWAGTVASTSVSAGDASSAGSTALVLVAEGTTTVEVSATASQVKKLEVGQAAQVTPAGATRALAATVASVSSDNAGGSTFAVVLTLDEEVAAASGTPASVSVVTGTAEDTLTVPTSALSEGSVTVRTGDEVTTKKVTVGLVGATRAQITEGLSAGDEVALADLTADVAAAGEITTTRGTGGMRGGAGFSGGSFPGGGAGQPPTR